LNGAGHDSVLLVITTVHGLRSAHGRLALKPSAYSSKLSFREHCPAIWYGTAFRLLTSQLFPGGRGKGRAAVWQTPSFSPFDPVLLHDIAREVPHAPRPSFPARLAWHSLGRKPCARRLRPFCFALSGAPCGFRLPRQHCKPLATPARCNLAGPPEKARPQAWEQPPLALRVPKPNGQKRSN
jgi:hypothetical protein